MLESGTPWRLQPVDIPPDATIGELRALVASRLELGGQSFSLTHLGKILRTGTLRANCVTKDSNVRVRCGGLHGGSGIFPPIHNSPNQIMPDVSPSFKNALEKRNGDKDAPLVS